MSSRTTPTYVSHDVAIATLAEREAVLATAIDLLPKGAPLAAFLTDAESRYTASLELLARDQSVASLARAPSTYATIIRGNPDMAGLYLGAVDARGALTGQVIEVQ